MHRSWTALALALLLAACGRSAPELLERAQQFRERGEAAAAIIEVKNALARDDGNVQAHILLGELYAQTGEFLDAERQFRVALKLGAPRASVLNSLGAVLLDLERYRQVVDEIAPDGEVSAEASARLALLRGRAMLRQGAVIEAATEFAAAASARPLDADLGRAQAHAAEGNAAEARILLAKIRAAHPGFVDAWVATADLARAEGRSIEALEAYRRALSLQPASVPARLGEAMVHLGAGRHEDARASIHAARAVSPASPQVHFARAMLALRERKLQECSEALQQVVRQIPDHLPSLLLGGSMHMAAGQLEQAQASYSAYLARVPGSSHARKMLAATLLRKDQPQSAMEVLQPLLAEADTQALTLVGQGSLMLGRIGEARVYLEKAAALAPEDADIRSRLGMARLAAGDAGQAVKDLESAVALNPVDPRAESYLVMALIARGDTAAALAAARASEQKQPAKALPQLLKGAAHLARSEVAQARNSLEGALKLEPGYFPAAAALAQLDLKDGKPAAARGRMQKVLDHDRNNLDAALAMAKLEFDSGGRREAIARLHQAQSQHPGAAQPSLMLAQILLASEQPADAVTAARKARELAPSDPRVLEVLGKAQLASGDTDAAIAVLRELGAVAPRSVAAQLLIARALRHQGSHAEALAVLRKALAMDPGRAEIHAELGDSHLRNGRYREALDAAARLRARSPAQGYRLEGDVRLAQADYPAAAAAYRRADGIEPSGSLRMRIHDAESRARKHEADDSLLKDWIERHPEDVDARLYLADNYARTKRYKEAVGHYEALLQRNREHYRALNNLAWTLQQAGDRRALEVARRAYALRPEDAVVADTLGWILAGRGEVAEALALLRQASALDPGNPGIRLRLAKVLEKAGDIPGARHELQALIRSGHAEEGAEARTLLTRLGS